MTAPAADPLSALWLPLEDTSTKDSAVSVILKLRGETCDIDCVYCFEKRKVAPGGRTITPDQVGRLETLFPGRKIAIELHGGEPLTAPQAEMAAILDTLAATEAVIKVHLQTNGVRLTADWLDLFDAHYPALGIGISLDGDEDGNSWRVGYDDQPVYPKVAAALDLLHTRGRSCGIVTVVTPLSWAGPPKPWTTSPGSRPSARSTSSPPSTSPSPLPSRPPGPAPRPAACGRTAPSPPGSRTGPSPPSSTTPSCWRRPPTGSPPDTTSASSSTRPSP
ncbi:radical SAM protein [Streptomyces sp. NPDC057552]|uniref:radical SAM protein n=1 Tax=Streptomyces sp. NPDC057552 TaxID=3350537 RepID=UPI00368FAE3B